MSSAAPPPHPGQPHGLVRQFGLLQATALNMSNMIGIGPFITIPLLMTALGGPQALLGWLVALIIVIADGLIWSELGAAMPPDLEQQVDEQQMADLLRYLTAAH